VNAEIAALETEEEKEVKKELNQVKAALRLDSSWSGPNPYDAEDWTRQDLRAELGRLRDYLTEQRREKNLLLEKKRRAARAPKASRQRSGHPFGPSRRGEWRELPLSPIVE